MHLEAVHRAGQDISTRQEGCCCCLTSELNLLATELAMRWQMTWLMAGSDTQQRHSRQEDASARFRRASGRGTVHPEEHSMNSSSRPAGGRTESLWNASRSL